MEMCKKCTELFSDVKSYRKNLCRQCYNSKQKNIMNERSMTLEGYLQAQIINIRNHYLRKRFELNLTVEFLVDLYGQQNGKCALSNVELQFGYNRSNPYTLSIDRIDSKKGYTTDNVQLIVAALNQFKNSYEMRDLYHIAQEFINCANEN